MEAAPLRSSVSHPCEPEALQSAWRRFKRATDRKSDRDASRVAEQILASCLPLIYAHLRPLQLPLGLSRDEMILTGKEAVWSAIQGYDPDAGSSFFTFVYFTIWGHLRRALRTYHRHKLPDGTVPLLESDALVEWQGDIEQRAVVDGALATLCPDERELLRMRFEEKETLDAIGQRLGISARIVSRRLDAALTALRPLLSDL